jgi:Fe-S-cluster-containing dehydrogenase component
MRKRRYAMLVDTRRCVGCQACTLACKAENRSPEAGFRNWVETETAGEFPHLRMEVRSLRCHHCENAPCVSACPTGASHVGEGGTVLVEQSKCTGCKACIAACPYDARFVHPEGHVDKCTFCLHRVREGDDPACVAVCPTQTLAFGDLANPERELAKRLGQRQFKVLKPEAGTNPQLFLLL